MNSDVYVEATSGQVLETRNNICFDGSSTGSGVDVTGATVALNLYQSGASYQMIDNTRTWNGGVRTWDERNSTYLYPLYIVQNSTNSFSAEGFKASVSAHNFAGKVLDFYKNLFNRNSLDNAGMAVNSYTHYGTSYNNAFWDGYEMVYGDGDGSRFTYLSGSLDVVGHEMTHGVISHTADLAYENQSGALNESLADTFGVLIETYSQDNVASGGTWTFNAADWVVGDEITTPSVPGDALRNLASPHSGLSWQPATMGEYRTLADDEAHDYGGVHINSGIPNHAAYLVAQSIGMAKTARIYYRALADYMTSGTDFANARLCLEQSARDLYGAGSAEETAVSTAFSAVGIGQPAVTDPYEPNDTPQSATEIFSGQTLSSYITSLTDIDWYKVTATAAGTLSATLSNIPDGCDYDLYLLESNNLSTPAAYSTQYGQAQETITYSVSAGQAYYLAVKAYQDSNDTAGYSTTQKYSLGVTLPGAAVTGVALGTHTARLTPGGTLALTATVSPANAANQALTWTSSNIQVATVGTNGLVTAVATGTATITVSTADGGFSDACALTVSVPVASVKLNKNSSGLLVGDKDTLTATVSPANATDKSVAWASSNPSVASVDNGTVTAVGEGTATITATATDGGANDSCTVSVAATLQAPQGLWAAPASFNSVSLGWNAVSGASGYDVYRALAAAGSFARIGATDSAAYTDTGLATGTTYWYKVVARRDGNPALFSPESAVASAAAQMTAPAAIAATPTAYNSIRVNWQGVPGVTKYELYRATAPDGRYTLLTTTPSTAYLNTGVNTGTTYYYKVRAYRQAGRTKLYGLYSSIASAATSIATPASVRASRASRTSIKVVWAKVAGATTYEIYRSTSSDLGYVLVGANGSTSFTNARLTTGQVYYYKVRAYRVVAGRKVYGEFTGAVSAQP